VAQFSQRFVRSVIRQTWNSAKEGAGTFREALNAGQSGYWTQNSAGWTVQSSSGAGYSTTFHISGDTEGATPRDFQELFERLLELYAIVAAGGTAEEDGNIDAMDSAFVAAMWALCPTIKGFTNNFMFLTP
jgi:hypothetical protein